MEPLDTDVTIPRHEYTRLLDRDRWLCALEAAGVDNWDGFDEAIDILEAWDVEDEN